MPNIDLKRVARLARLHFSDAELKVFESQVADLIRFVDQLKAVDTEGVAPTSHPLSLSNVFRSDEIVPSLPIEEFLKHSPAIRGRFFEVPKIIPDKS